MSVGMGEYPIGSNTSTALRFTSSYVGVLESDVVEQVLTDVDAFGQRECECEWFTPGPDENPL